MAVRIRGVALLALGLVACDVLAPPAEVGADDEAVAAAATADESQPGPVETGADVPPAGDALGAKVAEIIDREVEPEPGPRGDDLDLVEQISVTRIEGGWSAAGGSSPLHPEGAVFALDLDVEVGEEVGINQARLVAKATCVVDGEVRTSTGDISSGTPTRWGGMTPISADPGTYENARAKLFLEQDIVGHEPCQVEIRLVSPLSDKPMRVEGAWCVRDGALVEGVCEEIVRPLEPSKTRVRDWSVDRTRRNITVTLDVGERIWLDRTLFVRSSCDDAGERVPKAQPARGPQWGVLDPGDSARITAAHWNGWFAAEPPCELTAELWRRDDRGKWTGFEEVGVACVRAFLPEEGRCPSGVVPSGTGIATLRSFDATITRDRYDRRARAMEADVELVAHENIDGRYHLEIRGQCGKGRSSRPVWLGGTVDIDPAMLRSGEVMKAQYRGFMGRRGGSCEVEAKLIPADPSDAPIVLGKYCVDAKSTKPC